ncbi:MAG: ATP-binding protein [Chloroflexota bacterium]|nr:ATP-binding protein [Chloroflexota bacterium]
MAGIRMRKVFVPGGQPEHTYVDRAELQLEAKLLSASDNLCKLVTVTGPTKCGKSVLTQKVYSRNQHIWVDGGSVEQEADLWEQVVDQLGAYTGVTEQIGKGSSTGGSLEASGQLSFPGFAKAKVKASPSHSRQRDTSTTSSRKLSPKARALESLRNTDQVLVIDDFHYLDLDIQASVVRGLKALVFDGLPVILIAIPHRKYDAVRVEKEMTGRVQHVEIGYWSEDELAQIPEKGFPLLKVRPDQRTIDSFIDECLNSPHLMQEFCRQYCEEKGIEETLPLTLKLDSPESLDSLFQRVAVDTSKTVFERLAKGPRQRSDRNQRQFKDGRTGDIYVAVLHALANLKPGMTTLEYEQVRSALRDLLVDLPQAHEVSRVLEHMSNIQADEASSVPVLDWEREERRLHIIDPFFAFFLRWGTPQLQRDTVIGTK